MVRTFLLKKCKIFCITTGLIGLSLPLCLPYLGFAAENPENRKQNSLILSLLQQKADQGNIKAQIELALRYATGNGVAQNTQIAEKYLQQAASQGNAEAEYDLGLLYYQGKNTKPDFQKAYHYFRQAAAQDNPDACTALGLMFLKGEFVPKNEQKAQAYFQKAEKLKKATLIVTAPSKIRPSSDKIYRSEIRKIEEKAEYGAAKDQYALGMMYYHGKGVTKNIEKTKYWFQKACNQDFEKACLAFKELKLEDYHTLDQDMEAIGSKSANSNPIDHLPKLGRIF